MNTNFWNTQNIIILSVGLLAIPTGAAAGLYFLKKSNSSQKSTTPLIELVETNQDVIVIPEETIHLEDHDHDHDDNDDHGSADEEKNEVATVIEQAVIEKPVIKEVIREVIVEKIVERPVKAIAVTPKADRNQVRRLLGRISQATEESELHDHYTEIRDALEDATILERVHNVTFNLKNLHLDHRDETYLVSAMQNSESMRKYRNHKDAKILIFGYASKDNDPRNTRFALNRAKSAEHAIHEHEEIFGFEGETKSWCIGETDSLSLETDEFCQQHNRAAEVWLVVSDHEVFEEIESDDFTKTTIKESSHGHGDHH